MATIKIPKGPITISRGIHDDQSPMIVVQVSSTPRLNLHPKHNLPIRMQESDMKFLDTELSPEGKAALELVLAEVEGKVLAKAAEAAKTMAAEIGVKLDVTPT